MIKVTCRLETYGDKATNSILVHNHWNEREKVELEVAGERYKNAGKLAEI